MAYLRKLRECQRCERLCTCLKPGRKEIPAKRVVTRMDTLKSGWTPYVDYTIYIPRNIHIPRYTLFMRMYWAHFLEKWRNQGKRRLCKEKSLTQGLAPKYND